LDRAALFITSPHHNLTVTSSTLNSYYQMQIGLVLFFPLPQTLIISNLFVSVSEGFCIDKSLTETSKTFQQQLMYLYLW
jgi:hypothetical protein